MLKNVANWQLLFTFFIEANWNKPSKITFSIFLKAHFEFAKVSLTWLSYNQISKLLFNKRSSEKINLNKYAHTKKITITININTFRALFMPRLPHTNPFRNRSPELRPWPSNISTITCPTLFAPKVNRLFCKANRRSPSNSPVLQGCHIEQNFPTCKIRMRMLKTSKDIFLNFFCNIYDKQV